MRPRPFVSRSYGAGLQPLFPFPHANPGLRPGLLWSDLSIGISSARIRRLFWRDVASVRSWLFSIPLDRVGERNRVPRVGSGDD